MVSEETSGPAFLELIEGENRRLVPLDRLPFRIGRSKESSLVLKQPYVSRLHAQITQEGSEFLVGDAASRYGTYVNGQRVVSHSLRPLDTIQFGSLNGPKLRFAGTDPFGATSHSLLGQLKELSEGKSDLEKLRWFLEAARELNSAGKVDLVLASLLQATLALSQAERGYVFLSGEQDILKLALGMDSKGGVLTDSSLVSQTVMREAAEGTDQFLVTDTLAGGGPVLPESILAQSVRTVICIPLRQQRREAAEGSPRKLLGMLYLDSRFHRGRFTEIDHELLRTIAREAAALLENAQLAAIQEQAVLYDKELQIAAAIQQGLMALQFPAFPFASVEAHNVACSAVGGDFFDVVPDEKALNIVLVDVSGKGLSAAILASTLQGLLYTQLKAGQPLDVIAAATNSYLCTKSVGKYATMLLLRLHGNGLLEYINCGHVQPRLFVRDGVTRLKETNLPVGLLGYATYATSTMALEPGSRLILVSDGFTEAEDAQGDCFGEDRLDEAVRSTNVQNMIVQMREFCAAHPATDDCTIVQVAYTGLRPADGSERGTPGRGRDAEG